MGAGKIFEETVLEWEWDGTVDCCLPGARAGVVLLGGGTVPPTGFR